MPRHTRSRGNVRLRSTLLAGFALASCHHGAPAGTPRDGQPSHTAVQASHAPDDTSDAGSVAQVAAARDAGAVDDPRLLALVDQIATQVSQLRGLSIDHPIARGVMNRGEILARLRERVTHEYPPGEVVLEGEMLRRLGLIPEDVNYEQTVFSLLEEQVAGFYDPDERRLFIAAWVPRLMQSATMAHEITHALQDQHFDLSRFTHHVRGRGDAQTAAMAVVEGDATVAMLEFALAPLGQSVRSLPDPDAMFRSELLEVAGQPRMAAAPRALRETLIFPYRYGFGLCARTYTARGFAAVDELLRNAPASTEQVLHADKLTAREPPIELAAALPAPLAADHVLVSDDVVGEFGARLFLERGGDDATAERGAAGWGGDRAVLFAPRSSGIVVGAGDAGTTLPAGSTQQLGLAWTVVFDRGPARADDVEAREFEAGALSVLAARYPRGTPRAMADVTRAVEVGPGLVSLVARTGRVVIVLDRAPTDRAEAITRALRDEGARAIAATAAPTAVRGGGSRR